MENIIPCQNTWKSFRKDCTIPDRHLNFSLCILLIHFLIEKGANINDVNVTNKQGMTVLLYHINAQPKTPIYEEFLK